MGLETRIFGEGEYKTYNAEMDSEPVWTEAQVKARSRRSPLEISMDILRAVREGALGPTQIMYKANLTWMIVTAHLRQLVKFEMLTENKVNKRLTYMLTDRGIKLLGSYLLVVEQFEQFELGRVTLHRGDPPSLIST